MASSTLGHSANPVITSLSNSSTSTSETVMHRIENVKLSQKEGKNHQAYTNILIPDIWHIVATFLKPSTLTRLCRTSSHFLEIFRPILYRHLTLNLGDNYHGDIKTTLGLLYFHDTLAQHVISLTIFKPDAQRTRPAFRCKAINKLFPGVQDRLVDPIGRMTSLNSIRIRNHAFANIAEERIFVQRLKDCNIPVREFTFTADTYYTGKWGFSKNGLSLTNLTSLTWDLKRTYTKDRGKLFKIHAMR
jgi:hypothetical protein